MQTQMSNKRRARVRMLIQIGSLVNLVGLCHICNIKEGDDLQYDLTSRDKTAILVGILLEAAHNISSIPDYRQLEPWRDTGIRFLKQRSAQVWYQKNRKHGGHLTSIK